MKNTYVDKMPDTTHETRMTPKFIAQLKVKNHVIKITGSQNIQNYGVHQEYKFDRADTSSSQRRLSYVS